MVVCYDVDHEDARATYEAMMRSESDIRCVCGAAVYEDDVDACECPECGENPCPEETP